MQALISLNEFRALLDWWITSDPFPLCKKEHTRLRLWMDRVSKDFGYDGWVDAYHMHKPGGEA